MKLICHIVFLLWLTISSNCQKFSQEQFPFPPQFKPPNSGIFASDSSIYLPPESHTTIPYFSMNNGNKLPYQFLPPTVTKAPSMYPTPFPMIMSSSMMSHRDEENDDDEDEEISKPRFLPQTPPTVHNKNTVHNNQTGKTIEHNQNREMKQIPKTFNYQHPIDRVDIKIPAQFHTNTQRPPANQTPSQRRMIISSELLKNDQGSDQIKRSILGPQLIPSPIAYYSTTEPAIPILRLSNEMDLDGSFSYEALGADQTHYVQHSRMENTGTDKEEQIVEGSYSYVGDNGQTYTVHYVADSNGYRASGDHLPVPPPIPEIIQRAIQYNLAEEAKKPSHLKSWQENEKEYEHTENEKRFSISPPRNLFTGRTPEAFSFGLSQTSLLQNNVAAADNSQIPHKTNFDFSTDQSKSKINNGPIAPQITFLASQGAHNPPISSSQQQVTRIFATEKPTLPQIMNYEASPTDPDQENNKALWRWQYGLNANPVNENQQLNKNSISRSFGEGDDVIINFNNMSPEQYTRIMKSNFMEHNTENLMIKNESKTKNNLNAEADQFISNNKNVNDMTSLDINSNNENTKDRANFKLQFKDNVLFPKEQEINYPTENSNSHIVSTTENQKYLINDKQKYMSYNTPAPLATQSYEYYENQYESAKLNSQNIYLTTVSNNILNDTYISNDKDKFIMNNIGSDAGKLRSDISISTNDATKSQANNIKFTDFIQKEEKDNFKPIISLNSGKEDAQETTTTESNPENIIRENYFLRNLFKSDVNNPKTNRIEQTQTPPPKKSNIEPPAPKKSNIEPKFEKVPKYIQYQSKPQNEIKNIIKKPLDIADVLNYITLKNHFESSKLKSKNKFSNTDRFTQRLERPQLFIPLENDRDEDPEQLEQEETQNNLRTLNNQKQQELRGIIKNYKVLQRNGNTKNMGQNKDQFLTDSSQRLNIMQTQNLPPLGRAGPAMKSYLPPTYL